METLVVAEHRNRYYGRSRTQGPARFGSFGSPPSKDFREINCRTFQAGAGILPTPLKACTTPVIKRVFSTSFSRKTPSPPQSGENKPSKRSVKSSAISIPINLKTDTKERFYNDEFSYSELWAGPAYSNSPPPSSLPIPKFSVRPKRTVSLDLPCSASDIDLHPTAKSAPPSPAREHKPSSKEPFHSDSATNTLRRILNLNITDE